MTNRQQFQKLLTAWGITNFTAAEFLPKIFPSSFITGSTLITSVCAQARQCEEMKIMKRFGP